MGKRSHQVQKATSKERLILEAGYNEDDNPCPEFMRILAQQALTSTPAMNAWIKLTSKVAVQQGEVAVIPGEKCPVCKQWVLIGMEMSEEQMDSIVDGIGKNGK